MTVAELKGDLVILACAVSAGIHAALLPGHVDEGTGTGLGFAGATIALAGVVVWLTRRPASAAALGTAACILAGLLVAYALAITTGVPVLHPDPEPVEGLAVVTKAIETIGLLAATGLLRRPVAVTHRRPKGTPA